MGRLIGQRRGDAYPESRAAGGAPSGAAIQVGYDEIATGYNFTITGAGNFVPLPRIASETLDPLQVELDGVTTGDLVEVSWNAGAKSIESDPPSTVDLRIYAVVAFDKVSPIYPDDFFV